MDDDEHEGGEQVQEDEAQTMRSYSKKHYFGRSSKQLKPLNIKMSYKPKHQWLRAVRVTLETGKQDQKEFSQSRKLSVQHKDTYGQVKSTTKLQLNLTKHTQVHSCELSSKLKMKSQAGTISFNNKINKKGQASSKFTHSTTNYGQLAFTWGLDLQKKQAGILGSHVSANYKTTPSQLNIWLVKGQLLSALQLGYSLKSNAKQKLQTNVKAHYLTSQQHRFYLQHKFSHDLNRASPFCNQFSFNCQDSMAIGTLNTHISLQNTRLKSKQIAALVEFQKKYRFGVQKRNEAYEFMFELAKIRSSWLKSVKVYAGNKGWVNMIEGKLNLMQNNINFKVSSRFKHHRGNYEDWSGGIDLKLNL